MAANNTNLSAIEAHPVQAEGSELFQDYLALICKSLLEIIRDEKEIKVIDFINGLRANTLKVIFSTDFETSKISRQTKKGFLNLPINRRLARNPETKYQVDIDEVSTTRRALLPAAIDRGYNEVVFKLLENGCDPYEKAAKVSPLEVATANSNLAVINRILSSSDYTTDNVVPHVKTSLLAACRAGNLKVATCLANHLKQMCGKLILKMDVNMDPILAECLRVPVSTVSSQDDIVKQLLYTLWVVDDDESENEILRNERPDTDNKDDMLRRTARWQNKTLSRIDPSWLQPSNKTEVLVHIDASHNPLCVLPETLFNGLPHLETLNLSHCSLTSLPAMTSWKLVVLRLQLLDLSHNQLKTVPTKLLQIGSMRSLYLNDNNLTSIGMSKSGLPHRQHEDLPDVWRCVNLETLTLSNNQLTYIPDDIAVATKMKDVQMAHNLLTQCPLPLEQEHNRMEALVNIDLSYNRLNDIPDVLVNGLPHLETLNLSHCSLRTLPKLSIAATDLRLHLLDLSYNMLETVPAELFMIQSLKELHLNNNRLNSIGRSSKVTRPVSLSQAAETADSLLQGRDYGGDYESLDFGNGTQEKPRYNTLPRTSMTKDESHRFPTWCCPNLETLHLSSNHLVHIPDAIAGATKLKELNVAYNQLKTFPRQWQCPMERLDASHNNLDSMDVSWKRTLTHLNLSHNEFEATPSRLCTLYALRDLNLSHNRIRNLSVNEQWETSSLSILNLSYNLLTFVDDEVLVKLQNKESDSSFRKFWTRHTGSKVVPDWLLETNAAELMANQLVFPTVLQQGLELLDLGSNRLQCVPSTICEMRQLQILSLSRNKDINKLPLKLGVLKNLSSLTLDEVTITNPPAVSNILKTQTMGTKAILTTLRQDFLEYKSYVGMKLMVIGPKGSGKTTLVNRLLDTSQSTTDKIVTVRKWTRTKINISKANANIEFTVWDIEGGPSISAISQALFTPNTIYLLVWDAAKGDIDEIPSWLNNIKRVSKNSQVIAVASHVDAIMRSGTPPPGEPMLRAKLIEQGQYALCGLIGDELYVDSYRSNGRGLQSLSKKVLQLALSMKTTDVDDRTTQVHLIRRKVPTSFLDTREKMAEISAEQMNDGETPQSTSKEDTHKVKSPPQLMTKEKFDTHLGNIKMSEYVNGNNMVTDGLVQFLQETGSLIHVSDHTHRVSNAYFLDPDWLCKSLAAAFKQKGNPRVSKEDLEGRAKEYGFDESWFELYLQLLERFEIALKSSENSYILPLLLTEKPPYVGDIKPIISNIFKHTVMRWYTLPFVPTGFMTRYVCRIMSDINKTKLAASNQRGPYEHQTFWRDGLAIASDIHQTNVEMMSLDGSPCICLSIQSTDKETLRKGVGFFVDRIDYLIAEWYSDDMDEVERLIPCHLCLKEALRKPQIAPRGVEKNVSHIQEACSVFKMTQLTVKALTSEDATVKCDGQVPHTVDLIDMVPDVFLVDLNVKELRDVPRFSDPESIRLGYGSFGKIYQNKIEGQPRAVKTFLEDKTDKENAVLESFPKFRRELAIMSNVKHPFILKLIGFCLRDLSFAMELAPMGDLSSFLSKERTRRAQDFTTSEEFHGCILNRMLTFKIAFQLFVAIGYLHHEGITHADLKTNNIVILSDDPDTDVNVKLIDLGISQSHTAGAVRGYANRHCFVAPEIIAKSAFDEKVDIFSAGMILYHVITGSHPDENQLRSNSSSEYSSSTSVIRPDFKFPHYTMHPDFKSLQVVMEECCRQNPDERKSATEILGMVGKPAFLCLKNTQELTTGQECSDVCFPKLEEKDGLVDTDIIGYWSGVERCITELNMDSLKQAPPIYLEGPSVSCSTMAGNLYISGTRKEGIHIHERKREGAKYRETIKKSTGLDVSCLLYLNGEMQKQECGDVDIRASHMYVGLRDGRLLVYKHAAYIWTGPIKVIQLVDQGFQPCMCMLPVVDTIDMISEAQVVLVGCGDKIMKVNTKDHSVLKEFISVPSMPGNVQVVTEMICSSDRKTVWVSLSHSSKVYQFNMADDKPVAIFSCDTESSSVGDNIAQGKRPQSVPNSSSDSRCYESVGVGAEAGLAVGSAGTSVKGNSGKHISLYETIKENVQVCSLLSVKDTLWIGRSTGDIVVVVAEDGKEKGDVLAILGVDHLGWKVGPIIRLYKTQSNNVLAVSEMVVGNVSDYSYRVFLWQGWGTMDVKAFTKAVYVPSDVGDDKRS